MAPTGAKQAENKGMGEIVTDLWQLIRDYGKQETLDPLKSIGRFLVRGIPGALLLGVGILFAALAILRGLQTNKHLQGSLTWIPYLIAFIVCAAVTAGAAKAITSATKSDKAQP